MFQRLIGHPIHDLTYEHVVLKDIILFIYSGAFLWNNIMLIWFLYGTIPILKVPLMKRETAAVILPSLQHLHADLSDIDIAREGYNTSRMGGERVDDKRRFPDIDLESEDECGICLEPGTKMVLPNCCHEMCIKCFHDWYVSSDRSNFFQILVFHG